MWLIAATTHLLAQLLLKSVKMLAYGGRRDLVVALAAIAAAIAAWSAYSGHAQQVPYFFKYNLRVASSSTFKILPISQRLYDRNMVRTRSAFSRKRLKEVIAGSALR